MTFLDDIFEFFVMARSIRRVWIGPTRIVCNPISQNRFQPTIAPIARPVFRLPLGKSLGAVLLACLGIVAAWVLVPSAGSIGRSIGQGSGFLASWGMPIAIASPIAGSIRGAMTGPIASSGQTPPLTSEALRDRLTRPAVMDGKPAIDLSGIVLDLRPDNAAFRDLFYDQVRSRLAATRAGLDLSQTVIWGDLDASQLGLRAPLYGKSLSPNLTPAEQEQLGRDRLRLLQLGRLSRSLLLDGGTSLDLQISVVRGAVRLNGAQIFGSLRLANTYFLAAVEARGVTVNGAAIGSLSRFSQPLRFSGATITGPVQFRNSIFSQPVRLDGARLSGSAQFTSAIFEKGGNFYRSQFASAANFNKSQWRGSADFTQVEWQGDTSFEGARFEAPVYVIDGHLAGDLSFRSARFAQPLNFRGATVLRELDFTSAGFAKGVYVNVAGLDFDPEAAKLIGSPGQIGRILSLPVLQGNDTLLRSLIRNFRHQEQIDDANQVACLQARLEFKAITRQLVGLDLNTAQPSQLTAVGFSSRQAATIAQARQAQPFRNATELLSLPGVDLATYVKVRDRVAARLPASWGGSALGAIALGSRWLGLGLLILLSRNGTSAGLVLGVGLVAIVYFALMFWLIDRVRRLQPRPTWPSPREILAMLSSALILTTIGLVLILRTSDRPLWTLGCLAIVLLPIPSLLVGLLYRQGRYHGRMAESYLVENADRRQIQLLISRLPTIPRYYFFRERFLPILWDRHWAWLNYYDFSLNNLLRIGFNDLRLRDEDLPGLVASLVWYQWTIGLVYIALLLWTLSRAIPGLNLLIYFG